jgi:hypothetical protein
MMADFGGRPGLAFAAECTSSAFNKTRAANADLRQWLVFEQILTRISINARKTWTILVGI